MQFLKTILEAASFKEQPIPPYAVCYSRDGVVFKDDVFLGSREDCIEYMSTHKPPKGSNFDLMDVDSGMLVSFKYKKIKESKTFTLKNPGFKPRGAPEERARAFDPVNPKTGARPDRSVLKTADSNRKKGYTAHEFADEGDFISVIVGSNNREFTYGHKSDPNDEYHGINVIFFPDGKIDGDTYDVTSKRQWMKDKHQIVAVAKAALKDKNLSGQYDGLMGREVKRGTGKLSFDVDNHQIRNDAKLSKHHSDYHGYDDKKTNEGLDESLLIEATGIANELMKDLKGDFSEDNVRRVISKAYSVGYLAAIKSVTKK